MVARHPQPVPVYDVRGVSGMGFNGDGFQQWSPSAPQDTSAPKWSGGATDANTGEQIHWCHDEDQYFVPRLALYPPASLPEIGPTGIIWGFTFLEVRPEGDIDAKTQQAAVATAAGDTRSYAVYKDRHDILDPKSDLRVQAMNSVPTYRKGCSWRVFEKAPFRCFRSKGRLLPTELQLDALVATQPEAEEEKWQGTREELKCDFLKLGRLIAADGRKDQHSGEALTVFEECQIPDEQLTIQGWVDW